MFNRIFFFLIFFCSCFHAQLDPNRCCDSIYEEFAPKMQTQPHLLCLYEVVCNEALKRPLHHKEQVWNSVIRWGYWDEEDRKDCHLLLTNNRFLREVAPLVSIDDWERVWLIYDSRCYRHCSSRARRLNRRRPFAASWNTPTVKVNRSRITFSKWAKANCTTIKIER